MAQWRGCRSELCVVVALVHQNTARAGEPLDRWVAHTERRDRGRIPVHLSRWRKQSETTMACLGQFMIKDNLLRWLKQTDSHMR